MMEEMQIPIMLGTDSRMIDQIKAMNEVYGSKNLLPNNGTTTTVSGVTFTVNNDGSITVSGTATANATFQIINVNDNVHVPKTGKYILSKAGNDSYYNSDNDYNYVLSLLGTPSTNEDVEITINESTALNFALYVKSGTVMNHTIYPMLRDARIIDPDYVPWAKTNSQLAADQTYNGQSANAQSGFAVSEAVNTRILKVAIATNGTKTITLPSNVGCYLFFGINDGTGAIYYVVNATITKLAGNNLPASVVLTKPDNYSIRIASTVSWAIYVDVLYLGPGVPTVS